MWDDRDVGSEGVKVEGMCRDTVVYDRAFRGDATEQSQR